jgi:hypothetical protein
VGEGWGEAEALPVPDGVEGAVDELQAEMVATASTAAMRTPMDVTALYCRRAATFLSSVPSSEMMTSFP